MNMQHASVAMGASLPAEAGTTYAGGSELRIRLVSALVLAAVALAAEVYGGVPFALLVTIFGVVAFWEWTRITAARETPWLGAGALAFLAAGLLSLAFAGPDWPIALVGVPALAALAVGFFHPPSLWTGLGLVYVAAPCAGFIILRQAEPFGWATILFILFIVWATDIAAYFAGRGFGGPKLWSQVSPKKTWSGAVAGLAAAIAAGGLTVWVTGAGGLFTGFLLAVPLSIAAQAGDLLESAVKRRFGVKDASQVIPGHGGVLDRIDGLFGAAALAWLIAGLGLGGGILVLPADVAALSQSAS
jgi:phosphatidate cytidylyltransferase